VLEPAGNDRVMFDTPIFSYQGRRALCEHAYQQTRLQLLAQFDRLAPLFARHGMRLRREVLLHEGLRLTLSEPRKKGEARRKLAASTLLLHHTLDDLQRQLTIAQI
jgi:NTE family protein